ncbi:MAG: multicopper oxidase domain-containing protein, partial [Paracoccaceae bacterium]
IPHEFMFMSPPLMAAVSYRTTRADWSLFEHESLFEQALVLPGGEFSFVLEVQQNGAWMFMCMLPYHMQMGMMGQMATEGMAMDML